jgi:hypothetical protein
VRPVVAGVEVFYLSWKATAPKRSARRRRGAIAAGARRRHARHRDHPVGDGAGAHIDQSAAFARASKRRCATASR